MQTKRRHLFSKVNISGLIITAAFIGPGTVTTATLVGAQSAYQLVWLLVFAVGATYILQEMASRLGQASQQGLSQAIMNSLPPVLLKGIIGLLIIIAIGIGNAAYEGGNITGAALGLSSSIGGSITTWVLILGISAIGLLVSAKYKLVEKFLVALVALMSLVFITLMFYAGVNYALLAEGLTVDVAAFSQWSLALAIIGTTIVPYNLFLHAGLSAKQAKQLPTNNIQRGLNTSLLASIGLGGLVTFAILSSSVTAFFVTSTAVTNGNIGQQLQPLLGDSANLIFGLGLFSAGLTSAITAPLAAAYAIAGIFNWQAKLSDKRFLAIALSIVVLGMFSASLGFKPLSLIILAQTANALLLPISVILLVWVCNKPNLMGKCTNTVVTNVLALIVVVLVLVLAGAKLLN
ncbi:MAG: divalent metal cation transporter [Glaciecola sp.]